MATLDELLAIKNAHSTTGAKLLTRRDVEGVGIGPRTTNTDRSISTEIDGTVTCKSGSKKVVYSYQQDT